MKQLCFMKCSEAALSKPFQAQLNVAFLYIPIQISILILFFVIEIDFFSLIINI